MWGWEKGSGEISLQANWHNLVRVLITHTKKKTSYKGCGKVVYQQHGNDKVVITL